MMPGDTDVSIYDRLVWPEGAIEALLASGQRRRELVAFLGEAEYAALSPLAAIAARTPHDADQVVVIVPGIMGSQLGKPRPAPLPADLLWIDPADFQRGRLRELALPDSTLCALGPVLYNYLPLKLALEASGYTVLYHDYDWRRDIAELGAQLAQRLSKLPARHITLVGHSMGGLVGRIALRHLHQSNVQQLITLGTPHGGSYSVLLALRGVYPLVRRIAQLDPQHSAETLTNEVFSTFPSLYQMLPSRAGELDLFDIGNWPTSGPQPNATLLAQARQLNLGEPDARIHCVVGFGHDTVIDATRDGTGFGYTVDRLGDGTVPLDCAVLPGCQSWYCESSHGDLPRNLALHAALLALLRAQRPSLPQTPPQVQSPGRFHLVDAQLREHMTEKINWAGLDSPDRQRFLRSLNESAQPWARN